jgi:capsular exopolysaccharide synthesis family protein
VKVSPVSTYRPSNTYSGDQIETQQAIITSYPVLKLAGEALGFFAAGDTATTVLRLQDVISTGQQGYTNIIFIEATDPEPEMARDLANTVATVYQEYDHEEKNQQAVKHRTFVENQRNKARDALQLTEEAVRSFRERTDLISLDAQASVMLGQLTQTEQNLQVIERKLSNIDLMLGEVDKRKELSDETMKGVSRDQVGDAFMSLNTQLNSLKLERNTLLLKFTENHPKVATLQSKMDQIAYNLLEELRQRRVTLAREIGNVRAHLAELRLNYKTLPSRGLKLARLEREVHLQQAVVIELEEQYQTALIREADKVEEVGVLQWAIKPTQPINPHHPLQRGIMGLVLGLVLGVVFAVVAETLDTSIGTIEDVQEYTGTQVVGVIPYINVDDVGDSLHRRGINTDDERLVARKAQLVAYFDPQSTLAETYRTLRTNIEFVTVEKGARRIMVTSSKNQEGKSTTIANLAMTMAQLGKRTLLIDCDLRKPAQARIFGLEKEPGVTEVVVGNHKWQDVVRTVTDIVTGGMGMEDVLQTQGIGNLHIITSGAIPPNPAELLNSRSMEAFIEEVGEAYDIVLFDSPPTLQVTDATILGKKVDGTLVVYKAGDVPRTSLKRTCTLLQGVHIEVLGVILNGIRSDISSDYHDFGYGAYYAYGSEAALEDQTLLERIQERVNQWRGKESLPTVGYEEEDEEDGFAQVEGLDPDLDAIEDETEVGDEVAEKFTSLFSYVLLVLVAFGLVWQSGYLARPLELIPVMAGYPAREEVREEAMSTEIIGGVGAVAAEEVVSDNMETSTRQEAEMVVAPEEITGAYAIRIGAYPASSQWLLPTLQQVRDQGQEAFLNPAVVAGEEWKRLMVGSFTSWEGAEAHAQQLQASGVVEEFTVLYLPYAIELERSTNVETARQAVHAWLARGESAYVQDMAGGTYRVLAGAFASQGEAQTFLTTVLPEGEIAQVVLR